MRALSLTAAVAAASVSLIATQSRASVLYSTDSNTPPNDIFTLNQATGAPAPVGVSGAGFMGDLTSDYRAGSETIWGTDLISPVPVPTARAANLMKVNPATGAGTLVGQFRMVTGAPVAITSLAFDVNSGTLWGTSSLAFDGAPDVLYSVNPANAVVTPVGAGIGAGETNVFALGFTTTGKLYGVSNTSKHLLLIDTALGTGSVVANMQLQSVFDMAARPEDDTMFVVDSASQFLYTLNLTNGAATGVGSTGVGSNEVGLAFLVPEPGSALSAATLGILGVARRRRGSR